MRVGYNEQYKRQYTKQNKKHYRSMAKLVVTTRSLPMSNGKFRVYVELRHKSLVKKKATQYECEEQDKTDNIVTNYRIISQVYQEFLGKWEDRLNKLEQEHKVSSMDIEQLYELVSGDRVINDDYGSIDFIKYHRQYCRKLTNKGRSKLASAYSCVLNSIEDYIRRDSLLIKDMTIKFIDGYVEFMTSPRTIERNGVVYGKPGLSNQSINNRIKDFKAMFNIVKKEYCDPVTGEEYIRSNPFRNWKPMMLDTTSGYKAISRDIFLRIYNYTPKQKRDEFARDMFVLSFLLVGINATDLYSMEQGELKDGRINYSRNKTKGRRSDGAFISIKVPELAKPIFRKYMGNIRLFDFCERYSTLINFNRAISVGMQDMCRELSIPNPTYYGARHSWATIARNDCGVSAEDISMCLNHSYTHTVTDRYIKKDWSLIDRCNDKVIEYVFNKGE